MCHEFSLGQNTNDLPNEKCCPGTSTGSEGPAPRQTDFKTSGNKKTLAGPARKELIKCKKIMVAFTKIWLPC